MKAVIFDMDGVVLHNNAWHLEAWLQYASLRQIPLNREEAESRVFGRTNREIILAAYPDSSEEVIRQWSSEKEALYRSMYEPDFKLADGMLFLLDYLQKAGFRIALASNAPQENVDFALDKGAIRKYFEVILWEGMAERPKPFPDIYHLAAARLGVAAENCLVIEDSPTGIRAGLAAACRVIGISSTFPKEVLLKLTPEVVSTLSEIPAILKFQTQIKA